MTAESAAPHDLEPATAQALADLLLTMADDEFVLGCLDSEWTGIAPVLEEDVAFSSMAQDEIGHAQALYSLRAQLTGEDPDQVAYGREPEAYRHARLLDHRGPARDLPGLDAYDGLGPRAEAAPSGAYPEWAFSVARRFLYDTADAARLEALERGSWAPLAGVVAKMRREETYHLAHMHAWVQRLAADEAARPRLAAALERLWPDALTVLGPLRSPSEASASDSEAHVQATAGGEDARGFVGRSPRSTKLSGQPRGPEPAVPASAAEERLVAAGILREPLAAVRQRWLAAVAAVLEPFGLPSAPDGGHSADGDGRTGHGGDFLWLWGEFTAVARSEPGARW